MNLSTEQSDAAKAICKWLANPKKNEFLLAGFAGTGKTTLLQELIKSGDLDGLDIVCCAPTGKAASVLNKKLPGVEVKTIHRVLYVPNSRSLREFERLKAAIRLESDEGEIESLKKQLEAERIELASQRLSFSAKEDEEFGDNTLFIVDEASMVPDEVRADIERTGALVLYVGDEGQLPPVMAVSWFIGARKDARLIEVQRQALESPIIRLSMSIREDGVQMGSWQDEEGCRWIDKTEIEPDEWMKADQILTGKNASRIRVNRFYRKKAGLRNDGSPKIKQGDRLICLKNDWSKFPAFVNGVQFSADGEVYIDDEGAEAIDITYDGIELKGVPFYPHHTMATYNPQLVADPIEYRRGLLEADFGYCITVHKAQGSEWDEVIVLDDRINQRDRSFRAKWLYTAVTRAKKKLTIVNG